LDTHAFSHVEENSIKGRLQRAFGAQYHSIRRVIALRMPQHEYVFLQRYVELQHRVITSYRTSPLLEALQAHVAKGTEKYSNLMLSCAHQPQELFAALLSNDTAFADGFKFSPLADILHSNVLLVSWVIAGTPKLITEHQPSPSSSSSSSVPFCRDGFHSLFAARSSSDAQDISIFDSSQVLPRYLVILDSAPPPLLPDTNTVLWVDPNVESKPHLQSIAQWKHMNPPVQTIQVRSTTAACAWVVQHMQSLDLSRLRIITNRYSSHWLHLAWQACH
jgi:hypothetical protein